MEKLGRNVKFFIFSEMTENGIFLFTRTIQFQSWGAATLKTLSPILELTLGTTRLSSSEERRLRVLFKGLSRLCRYTGRHYVLLYM